MPTRMLTWRRISPLAIVFTLITGILRQQEFIHFSFPSDEVLPQVSVSFGNLTNFTQLFQKNSEKKEAWRNEEPIIQQNGINKNSNRINEKQKQDVKKEPKQKKFTDKKKQEDKENYCSNFLILCSFLAYILYYFFKIEDNIQRRQQNRMNQDPQQNRDHRNRYDYNTRLQAIPRHMLCRYHVGNQNITQAPQSHVSYRNQEQVAAAVQYCHNHNIQRQHQNFGFVAARPRYSEEQFNTQIETLCNQLLVKVQEKLDQDLELAMRTRISGFLSQDDIRRIFINMNKTNQQSKELCKIYFNVKTFNDIIWPKFQEIISGDKKMEVTTVKKNGENITVWKLLDTI